MRHLKFLKRTNGEYISSFSLHGLRLSCSLAAGRAPPDPAVGSCWVAPSRPGAGCPLLTSRCPDRSWFESRRSFPQLCRGAGAGGRGGTGGNSLRKLFAARAQIASIWNEARPGHRRGGTPGTPGTPERRNGHNSRAPISIFPRVQLPGPSLSLSLSRPAGLLPANAYIWLSEIHTLNARATQRARPPVLPLADSPSPPFFYCDCSASPLPLH